MADKKVVFDVLARAKDSGFDKTHQKVKLLAAAAGTLAIKFGVDAVKGYQDHQKAMAQAAAVIKSTGGVAGITAKQMGALADNIEANTGVDGDNILAGENMLATFTNIHNSVGKNNDIFNQATSILTDMSVAMGTDTKASAIQLGKALNDPVKGVTALTKVGVTFDDVQKKQIANFVKAGDSASAQKVILKELTKEFGGSAKAQMTDSDRLTVAYHSFQDQVGAVLLPVLNKLVRVLANDVMPAISATFNFVQSHATAFTIAGAAVGSLFVAFKAYTIVKDATVAFKAMNAVMEANPFVRIATIVLLLGTALVTAYKTSETFRNRVNGAFTAVKHAGDNLVHAFQNVVHAGENVVHAGGNVVHAFGNVEHAGGNVTHAIGNVTHALGNIGPAVGGAYRTIVDKFGRIVAFVKGMPGKISAGARGMWNGITGAFKTAVNGMFSLWNAIHFPELRINFPKIHIPGTNSNIGGGGFSFGPYYVPQIPYLAKGGITTGPTLAMVGDNPGGREAIVPLPRNGGLGGPVVLEIRSGGAPLDELLVQLFRKYVRVNGGSVQAVLGQGAG